MTRKAALKILATLYRRKTSNQRYMSARMMIYFETMILMATGWCCLVARFIEMMPLAAATTAYYWPTRRIDG